MYNSFEGQQAWPIWQIGTTALLTILSFAGVALVANANYPGSILPQLVLALTSVWCVGIVLARPSSSFLGAMTLFLVLGFWMKFVVHASAGTEFTEPTGAFAGTAEQWDSALYAAGAGMLGVALAASAWFLFTKRSPLPMPAFASSRAYARIEKPLAALSILAALLLFVANWKFAFVRVGAEPFLILPGPLHAVVSFLIQWGIALWASCMLYWAWSAGRLPMWGALLIGLIEGCVAGFSNLSRGRFIFHALAFGFGWLQALPRSRISLIQAGVLVIAAVVLLGGSLFAVQIDRAALYVTARYAEVPANQPVVVDHAPSAKRIEPKKFVPTTEAPQSILVRQIPKLVDRWVGLEGAMAVAAYPGKGADLFREGVIESPSVRSDGVYERISGSAYEALANFTFTTTAGAVAILFYSGSYLVVGVGMFLLTIVGLAIERATLAMTASTLATGVVGVAVANAICQVNQPYLSAVLAAELLASCFAIWLFRSLVGRFARESVRERK